MIEKGITLNFKYCNCEICTNDSVDRKILVAGSKGISYSIFEFENLFYLYFGHTFSNKLGEFKYLAEAIKAAEAHWDKLP